MIDIKDDYPVNGALCVFRHKNLFFLGYVDIAHIKIYGKPSKLPISENMQYQYVLNEQGGFIFINAKDEK